MDDPFESRSEREEYRLWALHAVAHNEPATLIRTNNHIENSPASIDVVEVDKLREAVKQLQYEDLVFIDQDDRVHLSDTD
jgi:hypothetical protein